MEWPDILVIILYFLIVLAVGLWASCRAKTSSATGFFLAERSMHWIPIGASNFASNIGAQTFVGVAGSAAANGIAHVMFEWHGAFWGMMVGFLCGVTRMGLDWSHTAPPCGSNEPDNRFKIVTKVHFLHFAVILAAISSIIIVVVSLLARPRSTNKLRRVTWWTRHSKEFPDISDDENFDDDKDDEQTSTNDGQGDKKTGIRYVLSKWLCGVNLNDRKMQLTMEERLEVQLKMTSSLSPSFLSGRDLPTSTGSFAVLLADSYTAIGRDHLQAR